ncbi:MAG: FkbM family methyltransferase [Planctomycetota bacterium]
MSLRRLLHRREKVPFAEWGHEVRQFDLAEEGRVQYAQWLHPYETPKSITQAEIDGLRRFIRPGDFCIDVGAHTGDTTVPIALAAGVEGCVLALEPNPYVFKVLESNAGLNQDITNIIPRCFAATQQNGSFVFHYSDASFCNGGFRSAQAWRLFRRRHPLAVEGRQLLPHLRKQYAQWLPRLAYVKVDAEGYDRSILASILPVLRSQRPVIRTEVFRKLVRRERRELYRLLADNGFDVYRYRGGADPQGEPVDADAMSAEKHFDILAMPRSRAKDRAA